MINAKFSQKHVSTSKVTTVLSWELFKFFILFLKLLKKFIGDSDNVEKQPDIFQQNRKSLPEKQENERVGSGHDVGLWVEMLDVWG